MSLVLDALKKAERERLSRQSTLPGAGQAPPARHTGIMLLAIGLVAANLLLLSYFGWQKLTAPLGAHVPASVRTDLKARLFQIDITSHIWSERPADRLLLVGQTLHREGGALAEDIQIHSITETGLIVRHKNKLHTFSIVELWPELADTP